MSIKSRGEGIPKEVRSGEGAMCPDRPACASPRTRAFCASPPRKKRFRPCQPRNGTPIAILALCVDVVFRDAAHARPFRVSGQLAVRLLEGIGQPSGWSALAGTGPCWWTGHFFLCWSVVFFFMPPPPRKSQIITPEDIGHVTGTLSTPTAIRILTLGNRLRRVSTYDRNRLRLHGA